MQIEELAAKTALVLETNNLRGGADLALVAGSLKRLIVTLGQQSVSLRQLAQVVITHDGLPEQTCREIVELAECQIDFVLIPSSSGYYDAKNVGFEKTDARRCDYIAFCDADCVPDSHWLQQLLTPLLAAQAPAVVAGRTSYAATLAGTALTTIDFMYFPSRVPSGGTSNFYANNVVFRRDIFQTYHYQSLNGIYRGHCQVMGLRLQAAGVPLCYASQAHTTHRLPDTKREAFKLRWMRGQDSVELTPHLVHAYLPRKWQWLGRSGPLGPLCVMAVRLTYSLRALNKQDLPPLRGGRWLATAGLILGFSALDTLGALARGIGINTVGRVTADAQALSYHR